MTTQSNKKMVWAGYVLTALASAPFMMGIIMMLSGNPQAAEGMAKYGWEASALHTILALEAISVTLYLIPKTSVFGAVVLTGYLGGAVATHLRVGEAPTMPVVVGVLVWLGLWLREPRLRELAPIRKHLKAPLI
jgi:hypothetical protein